MSKTQEFKYSQKDLDIIKELYLIPPITPPEAFSPL